MGRARRPTSSRELLDGDLAIQLVTLPVTLARFAWLIVAGAWGDWRARG